MLIVAGVALAVGTFIAKSPIYVPLIGVALVAFGVFAGWSAQSTTTILRKASASSTTTKRLIGGATNSQDFDAAKTVRVELITAAISDTTASNQQQSRRSILKLILSDNTEIILGESTRNAGVTVNGLSVSNFLTPPLHKEAQTVADFLGVPLNAADMSNPLTAIQSLMNHDSTSAAPIQTPPIAPQQSQYTPPSVENTQPTIPSQPSAQPTPDKQAPQPGNPNHSV